MRPTLRRPEVAEEYAITRFGRGAELPPVVEEVNDVHRCLVVRQYPRRRREDPP